MHHALTSVEHCVLTCTPATIFCFYFYFIFLALLIQAVSTRTPATTHAYTGLLHARVPTKSLLDALWPCWVYSQQISFEILNRRHTHGRWGRLLTLTALGFFYLQTTKFFLPCSSRGALQVRARADQRNQATCQHERSPWVRMCFSQGKTWDPRPLETKSLLISIRGTAPATVDDKLSHLTFPSSASSSSLHSSTSSASPLT